MKRALVLCSLSSALLAFALGGTPPAGAQQRSRPTWEYRVFVLDAEDFRDKADYREILRRHGSRKAEAAFREHVLNHLGPEGWELVQVEPRSAGLAYLYLRRPAP
ncbi:MAG: hypothetical protein D6731_01265 [Planctomycetota bacterium]|nr:MAG: hypothetical protein D6731_01265 [Planctomycetota bacterium]